AEKEGSSGSRAEQVHRHRIAQKTAGPRSEISAGLFVCARPSGCFQRTGFFSRRNHKAAFAKTADKDFFLALAKYAFEEKANVRAAAACCFAQKKSAENAFFHDKLAAGCLASARFFSQGAS